MVGVSRDAGDCEDWSHGDIGRPDVIAGLRKIAPVVAINQCRVVAIFGQQALAILCSCLIYTL